jgi:hypothetical protein
VKALGLLLISVNAVDSILCQVVELMGVLINYVVPLPQIQELNMLAVHCAHWHVVATERNSKLTPWHVVIY